MKNFCFQLPLIFFCISTQAQKVSNVHAEQRGQDIVVLYSLETSSPCEVSLLLSQDNGATWSIPLKNVAGDVGKNIAAGEKQITWKVLEEQEYLVGDKMKFKVIANGRKSFEPEMVFVEGGTFQMGSNSGNSDERPGHSVTLGSFNIGKYEVTQAQWKAVMGSNPSNFSGCNDCAVEYVSWDDVQKYILKLNFQTNMNYRLPTEAEWEYASKGGLASKGYTYSGSNDLYSIAWYVGNSGNKTHSVGSKNSNELGINDMSGGVWEWCSDWHRDYCMYGEINPFGDSHGGYNRVLRGGSFNEDQGDCRTVNRANHYPDHKDSQLGFRLVHPAFNINGGGVKEDAEAICRFYYVMILAQKANETANLEVLMKEMEYKSDELQKKYPEGSAEFKELEALIKPCVEETMKAAYGEK